MHFPRCIQECGLTICTIQPTYEDSLVIICIYQTQILMVCILFSSIDMPELYTFTNLRTRPKVITHLFYNNR